MTPCIYELLQPVYFIQVAESPCSRLTASCKSQTCCIFIGATPQSLAQIAALHPNIWLSHAAKMAPQVYGVLCS